MIKAVRFLRNQICLSHVQCTLKLLLLYEVVSTNLKICKIQIGRTVIDNFGVCSRFDMTVLHKTSQISKSQSRSCLAKARLLVSFSPVK